MQKFGGKSKEWVNVKSIVGGVPADQTVSKVL